MIGASDTYSPGGVRANGTPTNVHAFAKAFGCKDAMVNSGDKGVAIW
jgi:putative endopeptidase